MKPLEEATETMSSASGMGESEFLWVPFFRFLLFYDIDD